MSEYLPFILFAAVFVVVVAMIMIWSHARSNALMQRLMELGFSPLPDDGPLLEKITRLENNSEYRYSIRQPMRATKHGREFFFYEKSRHRTGSIYAAEEFLVPLTRPSSQGVMLFIKPSDLPAGMATRLIGAVATGVWDSQPDDLVKLELPADLEGSNLIGALGPEGASLYDLVDRAILDRMMQAGDFGAYIVMCRDEWCSFGSPQSRMPFDIEKAWPFLCDLAGGLVHASAPGV
ncbi:MAG: hypothetical protein ACYTG7_16790 [Planctomycetota bacterium]